MGSIESSNWYNPTQGEEILWKSNPSFIKAAPFMLSGILFAGVCLIAAIGVYFTELPVEVAYLLLVFIPFGLIYSTWRMLNFKNTYYVITNRRIIMKKGIYGYDKASKPHRVVLRIDSTVSNFNRMLSTITAENIGDIDIYTADDEGGKFRLADVPEVELAEKYLERLTGSELGTESAEEIDDMGDSKIETGDVQPNTVGQDVPSTPAEQTRESENDAVVNNDPINEFNDETFDDLDDYEPSKNA